MPVAIGGFHKNQNSILWETRIGFAVHLHNNIYVAKQPDRSIDPWSGEGLWWSRECRGQGMTTDEYDGAFPAASPDDYDDDVATSAAGVEYGRTTERTRASRIRLAMSCVYWEPKSRTTTVSKEGVTRRS